MCEILLRAYDKGRKEYFTYGNVFIAISKGERPNKNEVYLDVISNADKYKERFVIERYTGLTDKNGKKIFEGDIVKHYNHCDIKEYSEDIGRVFYYTETCRFLRTSKLFPDDCPEIYSSCEYEVIGNIHHNSYLLESQ